MALKNFVGESLANTIGTHSLDIPDNITYANFQSLTISIRADDFGADTRIQILDDGAARWEAWIRTGAVAATGQTVFEFKPGEIISRGNTLQITTGAAGGTCIVVVSAIYNAQ